MVYNLIYNTISDPLNEQIVIAIILFQHFLRRLLHMLLESDMLRNLNFITSRDCI